MISDSYLSDFHIVLHLVTCNLTLTENVIENIRRRIHDATVHRMSKTFAQIL